MNNKDLQGNFIFRYKLINVVTYLRVKSIKMRF